MKQSLVFRQTTDYSQQQMLKFIGILIPKNERWMENGKWEEKKNLFSVLKRYVNKTYSTHIVHYVYAYIQYKCVYVIH